MSMFSDGFIICTVTNGRLMTKDVRPTKTEAFEHFKTIVEGLYAEVYPRLVDHAGFETTQMTEDGRIRSEFIYDDYAYTTYVIMQPSKFIQKFNLN